MTLTLVLPPQVEKALAEDARRQGMTPEQFVSSDLLQRYAPAGEEDAEGDAAHAQAEWEADQRRRHEAAAASIAEAQTLVREPADSPTRRACRESPIDEIIVEKFRRQGFNL